MFKIGDIVRNKQTPNCVAKVMYVDTEKRQYSIAYGNTGYRAYVDFNDPNWEQDNKTFKVGTVLQNQYGVKATIKAIQDDGDYQLYTERGHSIWLDNSDTANWKVVFEPCTPITIITTPELKTGMRVILRNGDEYVVFKDAKPSFNGEEGDYLYNIKAELSKACDKLYSLKYYTDKLTHQNWRECDIMQVYYVQFEHLFNNTAPTSAYTLVWQREKPVKMTLAQIRKELGKDIELIPE